MTFREEPAGLAAVTSLPAACYHGRRGRRGTVNVIRHDPDSGWRAPLRHWIRHCPAGCGFEWGFPGHGAADLARSLLIDALGDAALCGCCRGRRYLAWTSANPADSHLPEPYDEARHGELPGEMVTPCGSCHDGLRVLPYEDFMHAVVVTWKQDSWRLAREEIADWMWRYYAGRLPEWMRGLAESWETKT